MNFSVWYCFDFCKARLAHGARARKPRRESELCVGTDWVNSVRNQRLGDHKLERSLVPPYQGATLPYDFFRVFSKGFTGLETFYGNGKVKTKFFKLLMRQQKKNVCFFEVICDT